MKQKLLLATAISTVFFSMANARLKYSFTKQQAVTDNYFGTKVTDNYRWLESMDDNSVQQWFKVQSTYTDSILDNIEGRDALMNDIIAISNIKASAVSDIKVENNCYFYRKTQPGENVSKIFIAKGKMEMKYYWLMLPIL